MPASCTGSQASQVCSLLPSRPLCRHTQCTLVQLCPCGCLAGLLARLLGSSPVWDKLASLEFGEVNCARPAGQLQ